MNIPRARASRRFLTWRVIYGASLGLLSGKFIVVGDQDLGTEPGWWFLIFGVAPTICVLAAAFAFPSRVYTVAIAHDLTLLGILIALLILLSNYLALVALSPLAPFIVEGVVLVTGIIISRRRIDRDL